MAAFRYDDRIAPNQKRFTNDDLLAGLRRYASRVGNRPFTTLEFDAWHAQPFTAQTAIARFGSWRNALKRIGIEGAQARRYKNAELVDEFERVWRELGRRPGVTTLKRMGRFSLNTYASRWGSVRKLGLMVAAHHRGEISRQTLLRGVPSARKRKHRTIRISLRWEVLKRDNYRCVLCGHSPAKGADTELHLDHILPVSQGGANNLHNLRTLCRDCNLGRGDGRRRGGSSRAAA